MAIQLLFGVNLIKNSTGGLRTTGNNLSNFSINHKCIKNSNYLVSIFTFVTLLSWMLSQNYGKKGESLFSNFPFL